MRNKIEKEWKAYHITWVTHNSRVSERMVEFGVRTGEPILLDDESRSVIADALAEKIQEKHYRVLTVNVLADHVHCVVVCKKNDVADIVQQLKGYLSHQHNRQIQLSATDKGRQTKLWAKGSSQTELETEEHWLNAIEYVQNNHIKHEVSGIGSSVYNSKLKHAVEHIMELPFHDNNRLLQLSVQPQPSGQGGDSKLKHAVVERDIESCGMRATNLTRNDTTDMVRSVNDRKTK